MISLLFLFFKFMATTLEAVSNKAFCFIYLLTVYTEEQNVHKKTDGDPPTTHTHSLSACVCVCSLIVNNLSPAGMLQTLSP